MPDNWQHISSARQEPGVMLLLWEPHDEGGFAFVGTYDPIKGQWFNNLDLQTQHPTRWLLEITDPKEPS